MTTWRKAQSFLLSDTGVLVLLSLARFITLFITNGQTGWHRDELDTLENARFLDWGYVSYPPLAPFIARIALTLFGPSFLGVRVFSTAAAALAMLLAGLMAQEMGGKRWAQVTASLAVAIAPFALLGGHLFHYSSFDYLWWVLLAYLLTRLLRSDDPRWWLGIGAVIGVAMMTKYTYGMVVAGLVIGVLATRARRYLTTRWLWAGVAISLLIFLPNLIWQAQHSFISLEFLSSIHARDVSGGRAEGFVVEQFVFASNIVTVPLWLTGLLYYFFGKSGGPFRLLGWMYVVPLALLLYTQGRSYYLAPAYPMLFAAGAVALSQWLDRRSQLTARVAHGITWTAMAASGIAFAFLALPLAPIGTSVWDTAVSINGELAEMVGWPDLVETVAGVYDGLPADEKPATAILTGNYGEAGAIDLYGPAYGLPKAISGVNSYWYRGYGDPPPQTAIVLDIFYPNAARLFTTCESAGRITNRYNVLNEESLDHPGILLCRGPRAPWPQMWEYLRSYG